MNWRRILIEWPATLWDTWWTLYGIILSVLIMAVVTITVIALLLDWLFGIRWGW